MGSLVLPDSNFYINCARAGIDPFLELGAHLDEWEFVTCGLVVLEVCRGRTNPRILQRFRERFAIMPFIPTGTSVWELATEIAWSLDRRGAVLPATDILIAACALQAKSAVLTADAHFREIPNLRVIESLE